MTIDKSIESKLKSSFTKSNSELTKFIIDIINRNDLIMALKRDEDVNQYLENENYIKQNSSNDKFRVDAFPSWVTNALKGKYYFNDSDDIVAEFINLIVYILTNLCGCRVQVL